MEIKVKNFGTISEASVKIGGLTVIAGENDSGKSTIGKILFSLVKAFSKIEDDLKEHRDTKLISAVEAIYFYMRRGLDLNEARSLRDDFFPPKLVEQLNLHGDATVYDRKQQIKSLLDSRVLDKEHFEFMDSKLDEIRNVLNEDSDPDKARANTIRKAFYSEFKGEITNKKNNGNASLVINDGLTTLLSIQWSKSGLADFKFEDEIQFEDATYVESSTILQFHHHIQSARTLFDTGGNRNSGVMVPLHVKDLSRKLHNSYYIFDLFSESDNSGLSSVYNGEFYFDKETSQFFLERNGYRISSSNVASGIKNLGIFDILVRSNHINAKSIVILDEPEVNLHPEWQIKYAKAICEQIRKGNNIIVTTHSPYMVEALHLYAESLGIDANFYLSETKEEGSVFKDVSSDLTKIISKLSKPLVNLHLEVDGDF